MKELYSLPLFSSSIKGVGISILLVLFSLAHAQTPTTGAPITIDEGGLPGTVTPSVVSVDVLTGQYDEVFTATSSTDFLLEGIFSAGAWKNAGSIATTQLNMAGGSSGYGLYLKFSEFGTYAATATGYTFTPTSEYIELWADPSQNTNYDVKSGATGNVNNLALVSGAASVTDDMLLGSATVLLSGSATATSGFANGQFLSTMSDFLLTAAGRGYFASPPSFYSQLIYGGNFQSFVPISGNSVQLLNNSGGMAFAAASVVPEPATLGLLALGLAGIGATRRRARVVH